MRWAATLLAELRYAVWFAMQKLSLSYAASKNSNDNQVDNNYNTLREPPKIFQRNCKKLLFQRKHPPRLIFRASRRFTNPRGAKADNDLPAGKAALVYSGAAPSPDQPTASTKLQIQHTRITLVYLQAECAESIHLQKTLPCKIQMRNYWVP